MTMAFNVLWVYYYFFPISRRFCFHNFSKQGTHESERTDFYTPALKHRPACVMFRLYHLPHVLSHMYKGERNYGCEMERHPVGHYVKFLMWFCTVFSSVITPEVSNHCGKAGPTSFFSLVRFLGISLHSRIFSIHDYQTYTYTALGHPRKEVSKVLEGCSLLNWSWTSVINIYILFRLP